MRRNRILIGGLAIALAVALVPAAATADSDEAHEVTFATFNASLNRVNAGDLAAE